MGQTMGGLTGWDKDRYSVLRRRLKGGRLDASTTCEEVELCG